MNLQKCGKRRFEIVQKTIELIYINKLWKFQKEQILRLRWWEMSNYNNLFIVDNSKIEWSVKRYLKDWYDIWVKMDVTTGYFEIAGLLELGEDVKK